MNDHKSSIYTSSVRSYKDIGLSPINDNLIKYMQNKNIFDKSSQEYESHNPPIMRRNQSYNAFNSTVFDRPILESRESSKHNVQTANIYSSFQKGNSQISTLQAQITRYASNEIILKTEKQLLGKQNKRLKEQIEYLRQKQQELNQKNEELIACQSKIRIIQRQYNNILTEYQQLKSKFNGTMPDNIKNNRQINLNLPTKIGNQYRERQNNHKPDYQNKISSQLENINDFPQSGTIIKTENKISQKVNWKKVSGTATSPIQKIAESENKIHQGTITEIQDIDIKNPIRSKINRSKGSEHSSHDSIKVSKEKFNESKEQPSSSSIYNNSDSQKIVKQVIKKYQKKLKTADAEIKNLRLKNIDLYGKSQEGEVKKIEYMEQINELRYQKSKLLTEQRQKYEEERIKSEQIKKELEKANSYKNKIETINKTLKDEIITLKEEKTLIEEKAKQLKKHISQFDQQKKKESIIQNKYQQIEKQLSSLKRQQQKIILGQTQTIKTQQNHQKNQQLEQINTILKTERDSLTAELIKLQQECYIMQTQLQLLREQNRLQLDNVVRLTKMIEQQRLQNMRLCQLGNSWNELQRHTKMMKHMNSTINHLWEIKQVEYSNINNTLQQLNKIIG